MEIITKARNQGNNVSPVAMPLYDGDLNAVNWDSITTLPEINISGGSKQDGIRSKLTTNKTYSDISGMRVGMLAKSGENVFRDVVTIVGRTNTHVIVKFDDEPTEYSVRMSIVRFVKGVE